jgi:hypothetical protein
MMPLDHARLLISALHPQPAEDRLIEITTLLSRHNKKNIPEQAYFTDANAAAEWAISRNDKRSVFVGVNPRRCRSAFEVDVAVTTALFLDLQPERTNVHDVIMMLTNYGIPPSIQVVSGNGAHLYLLVNPVDPFVAKPVAKRLCRATGGDATHNQNRIARIPGSVNWKPLPKLPTWCYFAEPIREHRYDLAQVDEALTAMGVPIGKETAGGKREAIDPPADWNELRDRLRNAPGGNLIVDMIHWGERNEMSPGQPTRSEADWAVVCALVRVDATDEQIVQVFDHFPIGTLKYKEAGRRYLMHTIETARRRVAVIAHVAAQPGGAGHGGRAFKANGRGMDQIREMNYGRQRGRQ